MVFEGQRQFRPQVKLKSSCQLQLVVMGNMKDFTVLPNMQAAVLTYCKWNWLPTLGIDAGSHKVLN